MLLWDRETLGSPRRAIVWQDRRTADICRRMRDEGHEERVTELTGLRLDPYFSGTKLVWLAENEPNTWALVKEGRYAIGTVDSYLIARMTRGTWHVTDVSNACRTLLFDLEAGDWSEELCDLFGVPMDALPEIVPNWGELATTDPKSFLDLELPIAGIAGRPAVGTVRPDLLRRGRLQVHLRHGLLHPHQHRLRGGPVRRRAALDGGLEVAGRHPTYALEGAIFVTGAAVQWLRDGLQIVGSAAETEAIAATVDSTEGVVFVPALTGLGAPHWDPHARGTILGITRGTTRAHLVRATLEAITFEVRDVTDTMPTELTSLMVDGGAAANDLLCQLQADLLGVPVATAGDRRDDRARGRVHGRARHRGVGLDGRPARDLEARPRVHPGRVRRGQGAQRRGVRPVAQGRRARQGLDRVAPRPRRAAWIAGVMPGRMTRRRAVRAPSAPGPLREGVRRRR